MEAIEIYGLWIIMGVTTNFTLPSEKKPMMEKLLKIMI
jgi:hypothetical protein